MSDEEFGDFGFDEGEAEGGEGEDEVFGGFGDEIPEGAPAEPSEPKKKDIAVVQGSDGDSGITPKSPRASIGSVGDAQPQGEERRRRTSSSSVAHSGHEVDVRSTRNGWLIMATPKKTLSRKGGKKERYFCLEDGGRFWYASSPTAKPSAEFSIFDVTSIQESEGQPNQFTLVFEKKTLHLTARTDEDAMGWILAIRKAQKSHASSDFGNQSSGSALLF